MHDLVQHQKFGMVNASTVWLAPGPLWWRRASYSRSGRIQFRPDMWFRHRRWYLYTFCKSVSFSLLSMFWPFLGLLVPTMISASKSLYRQPRFRDQLSQFDAVYIWSTVFWWTKDNSCPQEFQVRGSNQGIYGQPMVSLWSARCHTYPCLIHR
jgi:hypothetical protein